jgi:hypothetical protein
MEENNQQEIRQEVPKEEQKEQKEEKQDQSAPKNNAKDIKGLVDQFAAFLEEYMVKKAPFALPKDAKELIVKVSPYVIIICAILTLPIIFAALGLSAILAPFAIMGISGYGHVWGFSSIISLITSIVAFILEIMAVSGLFNRTKKSWRLVFYASIISFIGSILSMTGINSIFSGIIGAIVGWYILFQVRDLYNN